MILVINMEDTKDTKKLKRNKFSILLLIFRIISLIIIIFSLYKIYNWYNENRKNSEILNKLTNSVTNNNVTVDGSEVSSVEVDFNSLISQNSDTVGWIRVNDTDVNFPVVQTSDNSYYLTHNFNKEYNSAGWIFGDYRNKFDGTDKNIVIYGHNRRDGSMFATLNNILEEEWYTNVENQYVIFADTSNTNIYKVFSVYKIEAETYYTTMHFISSENYQSFLNDMKNRSIYDFGETITSDDTILTLSTCGNDTRYRIVLHAKKVQ